MARNLLKLEGLDEAHLTSLLVRAAAFIPAARGEVEAPASLRGKLIAQLFFEDSTRTRLSFEAATARLGGRSLSLSGVGSSASKGETFLDTALNVDALGVDAVVVRSSISGGADLLARNVRCAVINAGDGRREHPTQGLLDCLTIREAFGKIAGVKVAIVGDIANSRVARSAIHALTTLGATVRLVGPPTLLPRSFAQIAARHDLVSITHDRSAGGGIAADYREHYGLTHRRAMRLPAHCIVMHPGPVNRGVEVDDDVADDGRRSQILRQVTHGVAVRMAVLQESVGRTDRVR
jgi:aspartate carbamoyltransferase catalytic subunit